MNTLYMKTHHKSKVHLLVVDNFMNLSNSWNMGHIKVTVVYSYGVQLNDAIRTGECDDPDCDLICIPLQRQNATRSL